MADLVVDDLLRVWPSTVLMWIGRFEQQVIDTDPVTMIETGRILDRAEPELRWKISRAVISMPSHVPYITS